MPIDGLAGLILNYFSNRLNELALKLLLAGCRVDILDNFGQHPIHIAVDNEDLQICQTLLDFQTLVSS